MKSLITQSMDSKAGKDKIIFMIIIMLSVAMLVLFPYEDASAKIGSTVDVIKTIPLNDDGTYQHFVKICADKNKRLERPNVIVSSDIEKYRERLDVNLPPNSCTYQNFIINAENPDSITVRVEDSWNF